MEPADIAAIQILAAHWEKVAKDELDLGHRAGYFSAQANRAQRTLDHAIRHLRTGFKHRKERTYRAAGRPQDSTPLWG
jgi:hypothetical protein